MIIAIMGIADNLLLIIHIEIIGFAQDVAASHHW